MSQPRSHLPFTYPDQQAGFTLIELVLVLVLIGILGAVVAPRLMVNSQFEERLQADKLVGLLRQAQLRAMNDPEALTVDSDISRCGRIVITNSSFSIADQCKSNVLSTAVITQQTEQGWLVGAENLDITANHSLPLILQFGQAGTGARYLTEASRLGRPYIANSPLTDTLKITIGGKVVNIEPEGYIHAP